MNKDIYGQALLEFFQGTEKELNLHTSYGTVEEMPIEIFFREPEDFTPAENMALKICKGKILDIGAGAGSLSLFLQNSGCDVTALDTSPLAVEVMKIRGLKNVICSDIYELKDTKFDTLLLMMNGIGLAGDLKGLEILLNHLKKLLSAEGQIIFDSSDIAYLYEEHPLPKSKYYGEISYQYEFGGVKDEKFNWLYIDQKLMQQYAEKAGFKMQVIDVDEYDQYLAVLKLLK
jgi:SAM-dependent methyltransferase